MKKKDVIYNNQNIDIITLSKCKFNIEILSHRIHSIIQYFFKLIIQHDCSWNYFFNFKRPSPSKSINDEKNNEKDQEIISISSSAISSVIEPAAFPSKLQKSVTFSTQIETSNKANYKSINEIMTQADTIINSSDSNIDISKNQQNQP